MAHLSDGLFKASIGIYSVAMVGFTAEFAFSRVASKTEAVGARSLVGAGGPAVMDIAEVDSGEVDTAATGEPAISDTPATTSEAAVGVPGSRSRARRGLLDRIGRWSVAITVLGVLSHIASIAVRWAAVDALPWSNMYEFASVASLVAVGAFLGVQWRLPQLRFLGACVLLPDVVFMFIAGTIWYSAASPLVPALQSYWLAIHVTLASVSEGALMTSAILTLLYLLRSRQDKLAAKPGYQATRGFAPLLAKLPSAAALDNGAYRIVAFAFPLYTVAIICGAIWAEAAWGRYWGWDPKETWAFIVWVIYACYLHARATAGWKGRAAARVNLVGFGAVIFNFIIVNVVISGLHSYAGLS